MLLFGEKEEICMKNSEKRGRQEEEEDIKIDRVVSDIIIQCFLIK